MGEFSRYFVGDVVEAAVDHPEGNDAILKGITGRVAYISKDKSSILVDWNVAPDGNFFHNGNTGDFQLEQPTGWWIYNNRLVSLIDDRIENPPDDTDLLALFG